MSGVPNLCRPHTQLPGSEWRPALLRLDGVEMKRGRRTVLSGVNLTVSRGDFIAVTGPNGGGKTTLMRIMLRLLQPTAGTVTYEGDGLRISYLPQKTSIDASYPISVREVVASGLLAAGGVDRVRVEEALKEVELTEHAAKPFGALSGGQQQRALLARAIISQPEMLVLDEPLSYVDKHFEEKIYEIIGRIAATTTIILVSHEITRVASMANRHLIVDGRITECPSAHHFARIALCD